nr:hypothetical protein [Tanacetum cinerariifolium]
VGKGAGAHGDVWERCGSDYVRRGCKEIGWGQRTNSAKFGREILFILLLTGVVVTEAKIREALRLDDAEGVDCLPNEEIFTELTRIGYEKPSTKLTFLQSLLLEPVEVPYPRHLAVHDLVRNVDSTIKFYMYPRFLQLIIRKQIGDLSTHTTKYTSPSLTQKVGKGAGAHGDVWERCGSDSVRRGCREIG